MRFAGILPLVRQLVRQRDRLFLGGAGLASPRLSLDTSLTKPLERFGSSFSWIIGLEEDGKLLDRVIRWGD